MTTKTHDKLKGGQLLGTLPLFTPKWNRDVYLRAEQRNARAFRRGYEQDAMSDDELMFPSWTKVRDSFKGARITDILGKSRAEWFRKWGRFGGVDLSSENRAGNVIVTVASEKAVDLSRVEKGTRPPAARRCPVEVCWPEADTWTHPELVQQMNGVHSRWEWDRVFVESNAQQGQIIRWGETMGAPWTTKVDGFCTTAKKWDEHLGLPGIEVELSHGLWLIPYGEWESHDPGCLCGWCALDTEMSTFTATGPAEGAGDKTMALYFAWECIKSGPRAPEWANIEHGTR